METRIEEAAGKVTCAAIEVHRQLGPGYLETLFVSLVPLWFVS